MAKESKYKSKKSESLKSDLSLLGFKNSQAMKIIGDRLAKNISKQSSKTRNTSSSTKLAGRKRGGMPKGYGGYSI